MVRGECPEVWPVEFLKAGPLSSQRDTDTRPALIILNQPIADIEVLDRIWNHTSYRVCADGGANQLHDLFDSQPSLRSQYYYEEQNVSITQDPDQYSTDFAKAIKQILSQQPSIRDILVFGTIAGRLDQGIGLLSEFHREQNSKQHPGLRLWLFSEMSISFILMKGKTVIHTPLKEHLITKNIGVLPVYGPAHITTEGLEWDVKDWPTQMGGQVSTSNHIVQDRIVISTDTEVLFTVERNSQVAG
ncbi:hypothetical protein MBLNU459_g7978t2 [Dothideomycetes sp. NU459]